MRPTPTLRHARRRAQASMCLVMVAAGFATLVLGGAGGAALAREKGSNHAPKVSSFRAKPANLPSAGGDVVLAAVVANASRCRFSSRPAVDGMPVTLPCNSGTISTSVVLPPNASSRAATYTFKLRVRSASGKVTKAKPVKVTVAAPSGSQAPSVSSFTATPANLPSAGGDVVLAAVVANASRCRFSSRPAVDGMPVTLPCHSGTISTSVVLPPNASSRAATYTFKLRVRSASGKVTKAKPVKVTVAAPSGSQAPSVSSFTATPANLPSAGGDVVLAAVVANASSCNFSSSPGIAGLPKTLPCSKGSVSTSVTAPANTSTRVATYSFQLLATGSRGTASSEPVDVTVAAGGEPPSITAFDPTSGLVGTLVTITGSHLNGATAVEFNGTVVSDYRIDSATQITATVPAGATTGKISVTTNGGTANSAASFTVIPSVVHVCGTLTTSTTWDSPSYILDCTVILAAGVTLTVPAGTVVKAESEAGILVRGGSLVAEGSADSPIVFTSIHDGSAGGATDTNAPPAVGDWTGITVGDADDDSRGGRLELSHARLSYGGAIRAISGFDDSGSDQSVVSLDHVSLDHSAGIDSGGNGVFSSVSITKSSFSHNTQASSIAADAVTVTGSSFTNTAAEANDFATNALFVDSTTTPRVEDNLFASNHLPSSCESFCGALVSVSSPALDLNQLSDNTGSGNKSESFRPRRDADRIRLARHPPSRLDACAYDNVFSSASPRGSHARGRGNLDGAGRDRGEGGVGGRDPGTRRIVGGRRQRRLADRLHLHPRRERRWCHRHERAARRRRLDGDHGWGCGRRLAGRPTRALTRAPFVWRRDPGDQWFR